MLVLNKIVHCDLDMNLYSCRLDGVKHEWPKRQSSIS